MGPALRRARCADESNAGVEAREDHRLRFEIYTAPEGEENTGNTSLTQMYANQLGTASQHQGCPNATPYHHHTVGLLSLSSNTWPRTLAWSVRAAKQQTLESELLLVDVIFISLGAPKEQNGLCPAPDKSE